MGGKASTASGSPPRMRTYSNAGDGMGMSLNGTSAGGLSVSGPGTSGINSRGRARSLGSVQQNGSHPGHLSIPTSNGGAHGGSGSPDSDSSTPEEGPLSLLPRGLIQPSSLPVHLFPFQGIKCPVCNKFISSDDLECHLVMCLTRPRINYNEDVLTEEKGECVICLDELLQGDTIARLPCLCIYHKTCIDDWFKVNRSCPEHPAD